MGKTKLSQNISSVIFWASLFFIGYVVVGFLLKSSWLSDKLSLGVFYDLLKDSFGVTASLLAPAAAFVLFSDWRVEYRLRQFYSTIDVILELAIDIEQHLIARGNNAKKLENQCEVDRITPLLLKLSVHYMLLDGGGKHMSLFKECVDEYQVNVRAANAKLNRIERLVSEVNTLSEFNDVEVEKDRLKVEHWEFGDLLMKATDSFNEMMKLCNRIKSPDSDLS